MGDSQRRYSWQRVQNISHGAKANHKQTNLGLGWQALIFSQGWAQRTIAQALKECYAFPPISR
jgi:hypothetical protein